jgi:hypothetical protein
MTSSTSIAALQAFLTRPGLKKQFTTGLSALFALPQRSSLNCTFLYSDLPRLIDLAGHYDERWFSSILHRLEGNCGPSHETARVWSGMVRLLADPEAYATALKVFPVLPELEALPALGWRAYEQLLSVTYYGRSELVGVSRFQTFEDRVDFIFVTQAGFSSYIERFHLQMPPAPATLGDELRLLPGLMEQARKHQRACYSRDSDFYDRARAPFRVQFSAEYKNAVVRPEPAVKPASWMGVIAQLQQDTRLHAP